MSLKDTIDAIVDRAKALWPSIEPTVPLAFRGDDFAKPYDQSGSPTPFLIVEPKWSGGGFQSVGAPGVNLVRREGLIWLHALIPNGSGSWRAHDLVGKAATMFEGQDFGGIVCWGMEPGGEPDTEDGSYFGQSASIPFQFDETA